jgi:predicted amidohydrolase YtcJ
LGIAAAVTRRTIDGKNPGGWFPEQKITLAEALRAYTADAAWAAFQENEKGSLAVGKLGDFAVLSRDVFAVPPTELASIAVEATVLGGRVVFGE